MREYWLIDPQRRAAEFYRLGVNGLFRLEPPTGEVYRSAVLSGFQLRVDWLWREPLPLLSQILNQWDLAI